MCSICASYVRVDCCFSEVALERLIYVVCICLYIVGLNTYCVAFLLLLLFVCLFVCLFVFFLCLVYLKLPVSLDCPFLIATSVFSSI
jgi:hypothetical protein